jgi:hypothetical protein
MKKIIKSDSSSFEIESSEEFEYVIPLDCEISKEELQNIYNLVQRAILNLIQEDENE